MAKRFGLWFEVNKNGLLMLVCLLSCIGMQSSRADGEPVSLIRGGSEWRYADDSGDLGEAWRAVDFDDSAWKTGNGWFGFGYGGETTKIAKKDDQITYYFRRKFEIPPGAKNEWDGLVAHIMKDSGIVIYLNGNEILTVDLEKDADFETRGKYVPSGEVDVFNRYDLRRSREFFQEGTNVIAVELHLEDLGTCRLDLSLFLDNWEFGPEIILVDNGRSNDDLIVEDLDGDKIPDLLYSVTHMPPTWRKGLGNYQFSSERLLPGRNTSGSRIAVDIDADDDVDLIEPWLSQIFILRNNGQGVFEREEAIEFPEGKIVRILTPSDLDNDGDMDLATVWTEGTGNHGLTLLANDGNGTFIAETPIFSTALTSTSTPSDLFCADFDGDKIVDLLVGASGGSEQGYTRFLGQIGGGYSEPVEQPELKFANGDPVVGDITGDGRVDFIESSSYYPADVNGMFSREVRAFALHNRPHLLDMNNDGKLDVVSSRSNKGVFVAIQQGEITFPVISQISEFGHGRDTASSDLNQDGAQDIISMIYQDEDKVIAFPNWKSPTAPRIYSASIVPETGEPGFRSLQLDARRAHEVTLIDPLGNRVDPQNVEVLETTRFKVMARTGTETAEREVTAFVNYFDSESIPAPFGTPVGFKVFSFDADSDNNMDFFQVKRGEIGVFLKIGGNFLSTQQLSITQADVSLTFDDLNGDGISDLKAIWTRDSGTPSSIGYINDGWGTFSQWEIGPQKGHWYDLDADGDVDLVFPPQARINEAGVFTSTPVTFLPSDPDYMNFGMADLDGDGDLDVSGFRDETESIISWFPIEDGVASGEERIISDSLEQVKRLWVMDFDCDQDADIVLSVSHLGSVVWFENDGRGNFSGPLALSTALGQAEFVIADITGDGCVDLANLYRPPYRWLRNKGGGQWQEELPLPEVADRNFVDFDNDGDLDLLGSITPHDVPQPIIHINRASEYRIETDPDTDSDGLPDDYEISNFGNLDQSGEGDADKDGRTNAEEWSVGSLPTDASSFFKITRLVSGSDENLVIRCSDFNNGTIRIEASTDLESWATVTIASQNNDGSEVVILRDSLPAGNSYLRAVHVAQDEQ